MATIIDSLVISLALNAQQFQAGAKAAQTALTQTANAAIQSGKQIETSAQKAASGISSITRQVLALYAVLMGGRGLKEFVTQVTQSDAALGRFAQSLGAAPQSISSFSLAVERIGGSAAAAQSSFQNFSDQIQQLRLTGEASFLPWLNRLAAFTGRQFNLNKSLAESYDDVLDALHQLAQRQGNAEAAFIGRQLGLDPASIQLAIETTRQQRREMEKDAARYAPRPEDIAAAQRLQAAWTTMQQALTSFGRTIMTEVTPALTDLLKQFTAWLGSTEGRKFLTDLVESVKELIKWLRALPWKEIRDGIRDFGSVAITVIGTITSKIKELWTALVPNIPGGARTIAGIALTLWLGPKIMGIARAGAGILGGIFGLGRAAAGAIGGIQGGSATAGAATAGTAAATEGAAGSFIGRAIGGLAGVIGVAAGFYFGSTSPAETGDLDKWIREHPGQVPPGGNPNAKPTGTMAGAPLPLKGPKVTSPVPESTAMSTGLIDVLQKQIIQFSALKDSLDMLGDVMKQMTQVLARLVSALTDKGTGASPSSGVEEVNLPSGSYTGSSGSSRRGRGPSGDMTGGSTDFRSGSPEFKAKSAAIMGRMMKDYGLTREQAQGAVGWMAAETGGFKHYQEGNFRDIGHPGDTRHGWGWAQWTGSRHRDFLNWMSKHPGLSPTSDEANYGFMDWELKNTMWKRVLPELRRAKTYQQANEIWGRLYEGMSHGPNAPGVPNWSGHLRYSRMLEGVEPTRDFASRKKPLHTDLIHMGTRAARLNSAATANYANNSSTTSINNMHVYSRANDATGIAADLRDTLMRTALVTHAQTGPA